MSLLRRVIALKELRLAALAVAACGALLIAVVLLSVSFGPGQPPSSAAPGAALALAARRAAIEQRIGATPGVAPFFAALRTAAPSEYAQALDRAAATPEGDPLDLPDFWLSDAVKLVRQSRGVLAAKADGGALTAWFSRQADLLDALAKSDARLCVDFLYGGASEGFFRFAAEHRELVGALAVAGLDAIADGQTKKIEREKPSAEDFQALEAALRERGLSDVEITAWLDGKAPDPPLSDARFCEVGRLYLAALAALPEPARLRLYAQAMFLMARS